MRIAFVDQSGSAIGGAERSLELLMRHLPAPYEPVLLTFDDGAYAEAVRALDIPVVVVEMPSSLSGSTRERFGASGILAAIPASLRLAAALRTISPSLVYTNTVKAHVIGAAAARLVRKPSIVHLRDILEGRARTVVRAMATSSCARIAISQAVSASFALPHTHVISNPVDLDAYRELPPRAEARQRIGVPDDVPLVALIGRINRWKGHDRFVRIAARLLSDTDAHFAIVGAPVFRDADFADELRESVRSAGFGERFHFVPWLEDPRVAYAAIDVNCNCSTNEPFGRTIIEAAASGVPTVCFSDGGAREAVHDGVSGRVVATGDERAFAAAIRSFLGTPGERSATQTATREFAAKFDARTHARLVANVLDTALAREA